MAVILAPADAYAELQTQLLPTGPAWPKEGDSEFSKIFGATGAALAGYNVRANKLLDEADVRTTDELLVDWERVLGLPDECTADVDLSIDERRRLAWAKLTEVGGQSRAYFLDLAERYGEQFAEIEEGFLPMTCNSDCNDALYGPDDRFVWIVHFNRPADDRRAMTCNDDCNTALQIFTRSLAECPLQERKPAHTTLIFSYLDDDIFDLSNWQDWLYYLDLAIAGMPAA